MDDQKLAQELEQLRREIHFHNQRYYALDSPLISDAVYDQRLARLQVAHLRGSSRSKAQPA